MTSVAALAVGVMWGILAGAGQVLQLIEDV